MTSSRELYKSDFCQWVRTTVDLLRHGQWDDIDIGVLVEQLEDDRWREENRLFETMVNLLHTLLLHTCVTQSELLAARRQSLLIQCRRDVKRSLKDSPSLSAYLQDQLSDAYEIARLSAAASLDGDLSPFPATCLWTLTQILDKEFM